MHASLAPPLYWYVAVRPWLADSPERCPNTTLDEDEALKRGSGSAYEGRVLSTGSRVLSPFC